MCDVLELEIGVKGGSRQGLTELTTPIICEPLMCPTTPTSLADFRRLRNVDLVEFHTDSPLIQPDMLIGMDHHWDSVTGETM